MLTTKDKVINDRIEKFMIRAFGFLLLTGVSYRIFFMIISGNIFYTAFFLLYSLGLFFSALLLLKTHGFHFGIVNKFCNNKSGSDGCFSVIGSKGAVIAGEISWSDIGVIYFFSMLILILTFPFTENSLIYVISSWLAFPYTVFSVYYQGKVVHSWCKICLLVQMILFLLTTLSVFYFISDDFVCRLHAPASMAVVVLFTITAYFTAKYLLKSLLLQKAVARQYKLFRFRNPDSNLFVSDPLEPLEEQVRIIYHAGAPDKISVAFRFDCRPCLYNMGEVIETIRKNPHIAIEFIFVSWASKLKKDLPLILHFTMLYLEDKGKFLDELNCYIADFPSSVEKYSSKPEEICDKVRNIIISHIKWCTDNVIEQTPTYLLNDRIVSTFYSFKDLVDILLHRQAPSGMKDKG